ncbi:MAG: methylated-DNA--[protein]-cysteine S-methyltransferase [Rhabdochlamydiaceae bacterium]|jgi:methylated-DNA-[protein]-cysteine S-methyltransferase
MTYYLIAKKPSLQVSLSHEGILFSSALSLSSSGFSLLSDDPALSPTLIEEIKDWLHMYREKKEPLIDLSLDYSLFPPFTHSVLSHLKTIPFGETTTYGSIARALNKHKGARAVGNACGSNPFPLFIPCHRVLAAGNTLGGFSCGIEIKKELLAFELN